MSGAKTFIFTSSSVTLPYFTGSSCPNETKPTSSSPTKSIDRKREGVKISILIKGIVDKVEDFLELSFFLRIIIE